MAMTMIEKWTRSINRQGWYVAEGRDGHFYAVHVDSHYEDPIRNCSSGEICKTYDDALDEFFNFDLPDMKREERREARRNRR